MNTDRNNLFTAVCYALNVTAKFETSGKGKRPAVSTGGLAGAYAHLLCNPKNIPLVDALVAKDVNGAWFKAPAIYGNDASYRAFLYASGTSVRDVRGKAHVSADSVTGKIAQSAEWIGYCQAVGAEVCANKASGLARSIREGAVNGMIPEQVSKASMQLAVKDAIQENKAPVKQLVKALATENASMTVAEIIAKYQNAKPTVKGKGKPADKPADKPAAVKGKTNAKAA